MDTTPKALVVGIDGVRHDTLVRTPTPRLDALADDGFLVQSLLYPRRPEETSSGPGWSSIATGVWPDKHLVRDNSFAGHRLAAYPDFLTRLQQAGRRTYAGLGWRPLGGVFGTGAGTRLVRDAEREGFDVADGHVVAHACEQLANADVDAAFVYIGAVDEGGHGGQSETERTSWVVAGGARVGQPDRAVHVVDIAPTVFGHLGLAGDPDWDLDGAPLV